MGSTPTLRNCTLAILPEAFSKAFRKAFPKALPEPLREAMTLPTKPGCM